MCWKVLHHKIYEKVNEKTSVGSKISWEQNQFSIQLWNICCESRRSSFSITIKRSNTWCCKNKVGIKTTQIILFTKQILFKLYGYFRTYWLYFAPGTMQTTNKTKRLMVGRGLFSVSQLTQETPIVSPGPGLYTTCQETIRKSKQGIHSLTGCLPFGLVWMSTSNHQPLFS